MTRIEPGRPAARLTLVVAMGLALTVAGCGSPSDEYARFAVEGKVTLDGQPLKSGTISFIAKGVGASASAEVADGSFRLGESDGLSPGGYRVEVFSLQPTGRKVPNADESGTLVDETTNVIPERYNVRSELTTEIPPGGSKEPLSFALTGKAPAKRSGR